MAYADQQGMSTGRIVSIALVVILHAFLGYALVTGLAYEAVKTVKERLEVLDVEEEEVKEEEPPPPPPEEEYVPPPIDVPPTPFPPPSNNKTPPKEPPPPPPPLQVPCPAGSVSPFAPTLAQCRQKPPETQTCWDGSVIPKASACPPRPVDKSKKATPRNNRNRWVTTNDYPSRSLQREEEGTSRLNMTISAKGRVTACSASGATAALDKAACRFATRRARFNPALDTNGNPTTGQYSTSVRWQIPPR